MQVIRPDGTTPDDDDDVIVRKPKVRSRKCPSCGTSFSFAEIAGHPTYPFCSDRCRTIDLGAWLSEDYKVVESLGHDMEQIQDLIESGELSEDDLLGE